MTDLQKVEALQNAIREAINASMELMTLSTDTGLWASLQDAQQAAIAISVAVTHEHKWEAQRKTAVRLANEGKAEAKRAKLRATRKAYNRSMGLAG